jgi:hypothetical protein
MFGPFAGNGGTWVITGPETPKSEIPYIEGAKYIKSKTNNVWGLFRLTMPAEERDKIISQTKFYYHGEKPKAVTVIPAGNKPGRNYQPRGMKYWEMLHAILQEEPSQPSARKKIMLDAAIVGEAMAKNMVFRERLPGVLRDDGWRLPLGRVEGSEPGDANEHTQRTKYYDRFDPRARYTYEACTTSERMSFPKPGFGIRPSRKEGNEG